jgi:hypothetical protein
MDIRKHFEDLARHRETVWNVLKSPKTIALIKLSVALVGVVHAIDEFVNSAPQKKQIGFNADNDRKLEED